MLRRSRKGGGYLSRRQGLRSQVFIVFFFLFFHEEKCNCAAVARGCCGRSCEPAETFPGALKFYFFFFKKFVALLSVPRPRKPPLISPGGSGGETQGEERWLGRCKGCGGSGGGGGEEPEAFESKTSAASLTRKEKKKKKKSRRGSSLRRSRGGAKHKS